MMEFQPTIHQSIVEQFYFASRSARGGVIVTGESCSRQWCWTEVANLVCRAADALAQQGFAAGDHAAIAAGNSLEWIVADLAIQSLGGVVVPLHGSLSAAQLAWQLNHSRCQLLITGGQAVVDKLAEAPAALPLVSFTQAIDRRSGAAVPRWSDWVAAGNESAGYERWQTTRRRITPQTLASIVYTSGTSGEPRGVMLTQGNLAANAACTVRAFGQQDDDLRLNSLPFSHAFGRMSDLYVSIMANSWLALGRSRETLIADAQQVRPTLMVVVPLLLARLRQAAVARFGSEEASAIQKLLGGQLRGFICGGAALAAEVLEYFAAQGTPVYEGYGLTEASPVISASSPGDGYRAGSVGRLLAETEALTADDGELLIRGPQVMAGYWQDAAATRAALKDDWLHTGDLGALDAAGFLHLRGRKKEFLALANGKKVWPAMIEERFAQDPLIEQIMLVGEGEAFLGALVVPRDRSAPELNSADNRQRFSNHLELQQSAAPTYEQIRRVWLLPEPWTAEREELTPKLTLRRAVILRRYADCVRQMFADQSNGH